ncbi:EF-hand domain-containing protein [Saccharospirillum salsuginis]|uniref:EF-hand domain-containing protein n=1 Tax=Saccharospirillum salsuginis TaxID=418750 RepID=A0A918KLC7_9GAMM|nr:EF-hand domain-containing protein [Saccharospirillum salsuginis]GGX67410.1 hypothetical protein GCM10007392_38770 [Saccharospirillum salsuginis]
MKTAIVLSSAVLAFAATGAIAEGTQSHEDLFNQIDANGDGVIDFDEAAASVALSDQFETLDADGSGDLSLEEFQAFEMKSGSGAGTEGGSSEGESDW